MKAKGCDVSLEYNKGFTLPSNIGELGDDITNLDLSNCSLEGMCVGLPRYTTQKQIEKQIARAQYRYRLTSFAGSLSKGAPWS